MEKIKDPMTVLTVANTVGLISAFIYLQKQNKNMELRIVELESELKKTNKNFTGLTRKVQEELHNNKNELEEFVNEKQNLDRSFNDLVNTLENEGIDLNNFKNSTDGKKKKKVIRKKKKDEDDEEEEEVYNKKGDNLNDVIKKLRSKKTSSEFI